MWILAIVLLIAIAGFLALRWAIATNGPAVLDTVDRITGGGRDVELVHSDQYGDAPAQKIRVYAPDPALASSGKPFEPRPVIIFEHGGSWSWGDPDNYGFIGRALVPEGFVVVLAGYRLHPNVQFPAMLEDAASAIAWTRENIADYGGDPDRIVLAGHSAGAYNVVMTALDQQWMEKAGLPESSIAGVIGLAGPYDFYPFDSDSTKASFGSAPDPESTQPINYARGNAPPMLFIHGEKDTTVRPRNSRVLKQAITAAGGSARAEFFPEMDHSRPLMALASPYRRDPAVFDLVAEFARTVTSKPKVSVPVQDETR
ncbi:MAG: alpha/beta hydrolase [Erythrobacter sp.]